jgi:hypothetical protein
MPLSNISMNRSYLIGRVRGNRDKHDKDYAKAHAAWRQVFALELARLQAQAVEGYRGLARRLRKFLDKNPEPKSHGREYDAAIEMLELSVDDTVTVHAHEFRQLVRDEWDWKDDWVVTNAQYSGGD